eukprot:gene8673-1553_t
MPPPSCRAQRPPQVLPASFFVSLALQPALSRASDTMVKETGLYDLLGVSPDASEKDIQRAFRKLALKWHPDRVQDPGKKKEAEQKFQTMSEAFDILNDDKKRALYDRAGLQVVATEASQNTLDFTLLEQPFPLPS